MKAICIDLWNKRAWIAIHEWSIAFPKAVVARTELMRYLKKYFNDHTNIDTIIVWMPYDLYGVDTKQLDKTKLFVDKLQDIFPKKHIIGHDERFTSFQAAEWFGDHLDDVAAQCILQSFLDTNSK